MKIAAKANCPLHGFTPCRQTECGWFTHLRGTNPNTGDPIDEWGCAIAWLPVLLVENSQQQRQTGAAVESFRNAMVQSNHLTTRILLGEITAHTPPALEDQP